MTTPHARKVCRLSRSLLLGIFASSLGIISGIVPDFTATHHPTAMFDSAARADEFSEADLRKFAAALMQIEPIRQSALAQISRANNGNLPNLVCNQPNTMESLNGEAKALFIKYCNQCESIANSKGLTVDRFNQIAHSIKYDRPLGDRIRGFMN
jgi:Domain of unknown function (DUF4168)